MTFTSYPFDNQDTTESQFSQLFRELSTGGVVDTVGGTGLQVIGDSTGMTVKVSVGRAFVRGHVVNNDTVFTATIVAAEASPRIDLVVLRLDPAANSITPLVLKGTASTTPVAPVITQTDTAVYDMVLASVAVSAGAVTIAAGNVTDLRTFLGRPIKVRPSSNRDSAPRAFDLNLATDRGGKLEIYDPATSAWTSKVPHHWGTVAAYPTAGVTTGDTCLHTGLSSLMRWNGAAWRQVEPTELANTAALTAITTSSTPLLYAGFRAYMANTARWLRWDGTKFVKYDGPREVMLEVTGLGGSGLIGASSSAVTSNGNITIPIASDSAHVEVTFNIGASAQNNGSLVCSINGVTITKQWATNGGNTASVAIAWPCTLVAGTYAYYLQITTSTGGTAAMLGGSIRVTI